MSETKVTNRGGKRAGSGRPTNAQREAKAAANTSADVTAAPIVIKDSDGKKIKLNVIEEIAKIYIELATKTLDKHERAELKDRVNILKELLPYATSKKPIQSLQDSKSNEPTKIKIEGVDLGDL